MKIQYLGHSSFRLISQMGNSVVTDPYSGKLTGYDMPFVNCDIVAVSHHHDDHDYIEGVGGQPAVLDTECEGTADDICIKSYPTFHDDVKGAKRGKNLVFTFLIDGIKIAHLGDIGFFDIGIAEKVQDYDVLLVPVGGNYTIDAAGAKKYADATKAKLVIPMHYAVEKGTIDIGGVDKFTSLFDAGQVFVLDSDTVETDNVLSEEGQKVIVLQQYED